MLRDGSRGGHIGGDEESCSVTFSPVLLYSFLSSPHTFILMSCSHFGLLLRYGSFSHNQKACNSCKSYCNSFYKNVPVGSFTMRRYAIKTTDIGSAYNDPKVGAYNSVQRPHPATVHLSSGHIELRLLRPKISLSSPNTSSLFSSWIGSILRSNAEVLLSMPGVTGV